MPVSDSFGLPWLLESAQYKIFFSSPYTISMPLVPAPSKLGKQPCWVASLLVCVSGRHHRSIQPYHSLAILICPDVPVNESYKLIKRNFFQWIRLRENELIFYSTHNSWHCIQSYLQMLTGEKGNTLRLCLERPNKYSSLRLLSIAYFLKIISFFLF